MNVNLSTVSWLASVGVTVACVTIACPAAAAPAQKSFSGADAFAYTQQAVALGPRPDGSPAIAKLRATIKARLAKRGCEVIGDSFTAQTPAGPIPMENIIAKFPGKSGRAIVVSGHYDTKKLPDFVGANDGGSSTGMLLEFATVLQGEARTDDVYVVFLDGEEAVRKEWAGTDNTYGSRHLAEKWTKDGTARRIKALINVDMTGDKNLRLVYDEMSTPSLRKLVWDVADSLGYAAAFPRQPAAMEDDHISFINAGIRAVDLIDSDSMSSFWHTPQDTMDKLDPRSFEIVGRVVMKSIAELEQQQ